MQRQADEQIFSDVSNHFLYLGVEKEHRRIDFLCLNNINSIRFKFGI